MFIQKKSVLEKIDAHLFAGLLYYAVLGLCLFFSTTGWPLMHEYPVQPPWHWLALLVATYLIRYLLLPEARHKQWFAGVWIAGLLGGVLTNWPGLSGSADAVSISARILGVLVAALMFAYNAEAIVAVWHQYFARPCPWGHRYETFAGRRVISETAVIHSGRLALALAMLGGIGLYTLSLSFVFDFFAYSYVLCLVVLVMYSVTLAGVSRRIHQGVSADLARLEDALEGVYERYMRPGNPAVDLDQQVRLNLSMQQWLRASGRFVVPWESLMMPVLALLAILAEPYVIYILKGLAEGPK